MILYSHPTASAVARHTASALRRAGVLGEFWTFAHETQQPVLHPASLETAPISSVETDVSARPSGAVSRALDDRTQSRLESRLFNGVYAYEAAADATFRAAGRRGLLRVYDLPFGNWTAAHPILTEEAELEPEWAPTLWPEADLSELAGRHESELRQADLVFVGSTFGVQTVEAVEGLPAAIAVLVPGISQTPPGRIPTVTSQRPLRVLYAGNLSQRGGLSYAFRACRTLGRAVELTVVAPPAATSCPALEHELKHVRWLPTAATEVVQREMDRHDVFLFPAIYDADNRVLLEALTRGLPILATAHSAAPDLIADGIDGYIVPTRSPDAIVEKLELLRDPQRRAEMSRQAQRRARARSWEHYEATVASCVGQALRCRAART